MDGGVIVFYMLKWYGGTNHVRDDHPLTLRNIVHWFYAAPGCPRETAYVEDPAIRKPFRPFSEVEQRSVTSNCNAERYWALGLINYVYRTSS